MSFELRDALQQLGVHVAVRLPDPSRMERLDRWLASAPGRAGRQFVDAAALARRRPGRVVHALYYDPALLISRDPLVVTVYDMVHERHGDQRRLLSVFKRAAVRRADAVVAISEASAADLRHFYPDVGDVSVVYPGVSQPFIDAHPTCGAAGDRPDRTHVLYVGRRAGYKNFELLVRAYTVSAELRALPLVLVGGGPLDADERKALADALPAERVRHLDRSSEQELLECYDRALVTVVPSKAEGFGLPVLEAMARRSPVACSTAPSLVEVAAGHARTFDPSSPEELAAAVLSALDTPPSALDAARRHAAAFTWQRSAQHHVAIYESLL